MLRRATVIALHWPSVFSILSRVAGGASHPWVLILFVAIAPLWTGMMLARGRLSRPGPKLSAGFRRAYPWMHRTLHLLRALTASAIAFRLIGAPLRFLDAWMMLLVTLAAATFHSVFDVWRQTALYDKALRLMTPRLVHTWL